jgi:GTP-binding protein EngB required for normal cell division
MAAVRNRLGDVPESLEKEVSDRRKEVIDLFNGQQFLLLGGEGHGKSSLINTFGHVTRLADPNVVFEEVAQEGACYGSTKTVNLTRYTKENSMLFYGVPDQTPPRNFPVFLDTIGLNEEVRYAEFVEALAAGRIPEGEDLQAMLEAIPTDYNDVHPNEDMAAWSIIFVGSVMHQPLLKLAVAVGGAADKRTREGQEVRVYCVLTHKDKLGKSDREKKALSESVKQYSKAMRIPEHRIMILSNYVSDEIQANGRTKPDLEKDLEILNAFRQILSKSGTRNWPNAKARGETGEVDVAALRSDYGHRR